MGIAFALIFLLIGLIWLLDNPIGWLFIGLGVLAFTIFLYANNKERKAKRMTDMASMADELRRLSKGFEPIEESYLSRKP